MRFGLAGISHETNTFHSIPTKYENFEKSGVLLRGHEIQKLYETPSTIGGFYKASKDFGLVIGSRYINEGGSNGWDFKRKLLSSYANKLSKILLRSKINDMTSGFRSYSSEALNEINYFSTKSDGYSFQIEMTIRSIEKKLSIKEVPIIFTERSLGNSKMSKKIVYEAILFLLNNGVKRWLNIKIT